MQILNGKYKFRDQKEAKKDSNKFANEGGGKDDDNDYCRVIHCVTQQNLKQSSSFLFQFLVI